MAVFGETLRQARAYKGVTLKEAEQATRINRHHLAALEDENFAALPPLIYQRGIVRNYAVFLDLDPNKVLTMFEDAHGSASTTGSIPMAVKPLEMPNHFTPNFAIIAFMVVLSAIVFAWVYSVYRGPSDVLPTPTMQTTVTPMTSGAAAAPVLPTATATPDRGDDEDEVDGASTPEAEESTAGTTRPMSEANARRTEVAATQAAQAAEPTAEPTEATEDVTAAGADEEPTATAQAPRQSREDREATEAAEEAADAEQESADATQAAADEAMLTISFTPTATVYLTVYGDGVLLYDGQVEAGTELGPYNAYSYDIYTSDSVNTLINNLDEGTTFYMPVQSFSLP
ncbi:MAG TPA: helix-turn-helix domain-containing protein [Thermomicrobiales bacterium]|jgi:cytoskeletal protein RodZ|nr:helix-turn-helix domain-containing protein [Thermomicrobiales bacterium]